MSLLDELIMKSHIAVRKLQSEYGVIPSHDALYAIKCSHEYTHMALELMWKLPSRDLHHRSKEVEDVCECLALVLWYRGISKEQQELN